MASMKTLLGIFAEWVRQILRPVGRNSASNDVQTKIAAIRRVARESHPTADIDQILAEIERGYDSGGPPPA
jgi:hypothetical protein